MAERTDEAMALVYREKVASLTQALMADGGAAAMELVRSLVDEIRLVPENGANRIEVLGELAAILGLSGGANINGGGSNSKSLSGSAEALSEQVKLVAGTGFEPVTFRL